jgi:septation ring formation regulator EzrA
MYPLQVPGGPELVIVLVILLLVVVVLLVPIALLGAAVYLWSRRKGRVEELEARVEELEARERRAEPPTEERREE